MIFSKKQYLIVGFLFILFILFVVFWPTYRRDKSPSYEVTTINKDTGQTIINLPNQQPEKGGGNGYVTVLGDGKFINAGMTEAQLTLAEQLIASYVNNQLQGQYQQVAILNDDFKSTGTMITAQMRLGSSSTLLNIKVGYHDLTYVSLSVSDPAGNPKYTYSSGDINVSSENSSNPT